MNKWDQRFMSVAFLVSSWSSCARHNVGAVIVRDRRILTTGYNGAPAGISTCIDRDTCLRDELRIESGTRHEMCFAIHAEQNAIIQGAKLGLSLQNTTMYCTHKPCSICAKLIINSGITRVIYKNDYPDAFSEELLKSANVKLEKWIGNDENENDT